MSPQQAQQRINVINQEIAGHEKAIAALTGEANQLARIVFGYDENDDHHRREMQKTIDKIRSWDDGTHPWLQSQENARAEAEESRRRAAERAAQNKARQDAEFERVEQLARQTAILR